MSSENDSERTSIIQLRINTGDAAPVKSQLRRILFAKERVMQQLLEEMITSEIVMPFSSPWAQRVMHLDDFVFAIGD